MNIDNPFAMVVLIVLITMAAKVANTWVKSGYKTGLNKAEAEELETLRSDIRRLKERINVLEKLTTDGDALLREQFRELA